MPALRKNEYIQETMEIVKILLPKSTDRIRKVFMERIPKSITIDKEYIEKNIQEKLEKSSVDRCKKIHRLAMQHIRDYIKELEYAKGRSEFDQVVSLIEEVARTWDTFDYSYRYSKVKPFDVRKELRLINKDTGILIEETDIDAFLKKEIEVINSEAEIQKMKNYYYGLGDVSVVDTRTKRDIETAETRAIEVKKVIKQYRAQIKAKESGFDLTKLEDDLKKM